MADGRSAITREQCIPMKQLDLFRQRGPAPERPRQSKQVRKRTAKDHVLAKEQLDARKSRQNEIAFLIRGLHLPPKQEAALLALGRRWVRHGGKPINPGIKALAKTAKCSIRTVQYALREGEAMAVLDRHQLHGREALADLYSIDMAGLTRAAKIRTAEANRRRSMQMRQACIQKRLDDERRAAKRVA